MTLVYLLVAVLLVFSLAVFVYIAGPSLVLEVRANKAQKALFRLYRYTSFYEDDAKSKLAMAGFCDETIKRCLRYLAKMAEEDKKPNARRVRVKCRIDGLRGQRIYQFKEGIQHG